MSPEILPSGRGARFAARTVAVGALLLGLATAGTAAAQARGDQAGAMRQACAGDVKTLCPGIEPGGGRLKQCLRDNAAKLSPGCRDALKEARAAKAGAKPATP